MAYDLKLTERIAKILSKENKIIQKKMFGGVCFMHRGNMLCAVDEKLLMLRVGRDNYQKALLQKHTKKMDFTGRPLKGFIYVNPKGTKDNNSLKKWLKLGMKYTNTLPEKIKKHNGFFKSQKKTSDGQTPLSAAKNFGPVSLAEYNSMGINTLEQIDKLGFEEMCRTYVNYYPERLNANVFLGVICSLERTVWTKASSEQRKQARAMAKTLRREFGV